MKLFIEEEIIEEISPLPESNDRAIVKLPTPLYTKEVNRPSDELKEIIANDALATTTRNAAAIHNVDKSSAAKYANGEQVSEDVRARILGRKYEIEDLAVTRLMDTLNMLSPHDMEKPRDKIALLNGLSSLVDKITDQKSDRSGQQVILHLYGPKQNKEQDYETIDV